MDRRQFIKSGILATTALALPLPSLASTTKIGYPTGLQLYSVKALMEKAPLKTLEALIQLGFTHFESANYINGLFYGMPAKQFKQRLDSLGAQMISGHAWFQPKHWNSKTKDFTDEWKQTVEDAVSIGQQQIVNFWIDQSIRQDDRQMLNFIELFNKNGEFCQRAGIRYTFHNEHYEFVDRIGDKSLYQVIMDNTDPSAVFHQLDIGNVINGKSNALKLLQRYPNRYSSLHVKDMIKSQQPNTLGYESTVIGTGVLDVKATVELALANQPINNLIIEIPHSQNTPKLQACQLSLQQLQQWSLA